MLEPSPFRGFAKKHVPCTKTPLVAQRGAAKAAPHELGTALLCRRNRRRKIDGSLGLFADIYLNCVHVNRCIFLGSVQQPRLSKRHHYPRCVSWHCMLVFDENGHSIGRLQAAERR